ncbi:uncharacterized protein LOC144620147 isoform X2 [Crassostrea virginica]
MECFRPAYILFSRLKYSMLLAFLIMDLAASKTYVQLNRGKRFTKEDKCYGSAKSMDVVYDCPKNTKALQERAARKNCQIYPSCQNEPLVFHCVRYTDSLVEVCAPRGLITGGCCAQFEIGIGRVVEDYSKPCLECQFHYYSNDSFMYSTCLEIAPKAASLTSELFNKETRVVELNTLLQSHKPCDTKTRVKRFANCKNDQLTTTSTLGWFFLTKSTENKTKQASSAESTENGQYHVYISALVPTVLIVIGVVLFCTYRYKYSKYMLAILNIIYSLTKF